MSQSTAVTKKPGTELVAKITGDWAPKLQGVCYKGFSPDRLAAGFMLAAAKEPKLLQAEPASLYIALGTVARLGLDIGQGIDLVALNRNFAKKGQPNDWRVVAEAWPDYRGLKALAMRQRIIRTMEEHVVYEGDQFEVELGLDPVLKHKPGREDARGALVGAYTIITLPFGVRTFHWMTIGDIERIREKSKSWGKSVSDTCPPWYAKKTVVRDWLNRQPKDGALALALAADDTAQDELQLVNRETGEVRPASAAADDADFEEIPAALAAMDDDPFAPADA